MLSMARNINMRHCPRYVVVFCLLVLFRVSNSYAGLPSQIHISVMPSSREYGANEKIMMEVSYINTSDQAVRVLLWDTVLNGRINVDFLYVEREGYQLPYSGRTYKRARPVKDDYIVMEPGQTYRAEVDLVTGYNIDFKGEYTLGLKKHTRARKEFKTRKFLLNNDRTVQKKTVSVPQYKRTPVFDVQPTSRNDQVVSCSAAQRSAADSALSAAETISLISRNDLRNTPINSRSNSERYIEWFGVYNLGRWNTVQRHFDRIYDAISRQTVNFLCIAPANPDFGVFAYVYPNSPNFIYLGSAFDSARLTGSDSKSGTIVHELSHFTVLGGTDDHEYGQRDARELAINNPNLAIDNADNHEYFAENSPALSMPLLDVSVRSATASSNNPRAGSLINITGVVSNLGNVIAPASFISVKSSEDTVISLNDPSLSQVSTPAIVAGSNISFQIAFNAPIEQGEYFVGVCVSAPVDEVTSNNNCSTALKLTVGKSASISPILLILLDD